LTGENATSKVVLFSGTAYAPATVPLLDKHTLKLVENLRDLWIRTQLAGRGDFDRACLLIAGDQSTTVERYASAFFQGAQIFSRRRLTFYTTKSEAVSEDEMWLARILQALESGDYTSARYLIALRIATDGRRRLMFLAQGLASHLVQVPRTQTEHKHLL
jgi:hypothetical protein